MSQATTEGQGPKRRRHHSFDESVNEPDKLIEAEPGDVQTAVPYDQNESVETVEEEKVPVDPPSFED